MSIQVTKVWWDGEKMMAEPIPEHELYEVHVSDYQCRRLLYGFMLDCNAVGLEQAAKNLHKGMKQATNGSEGNT
jgi:hypothetical protein